MGRELRLSHVALYCCGWMEKGKRKREREMVREREKERERGREGATAIKGEELF